MSSATDLAAASRLGRRGFLRLAGAGGLAVGGASLLAACGSSGSSSSAAAGSSASASGAASYGAVSLALGWVEDHEFGGEFFATDKGYYKANGFSKVTLLPGGGQTLPTDTLISGQSQIALPATPTETASKVANGAGLKIIGSTYVLNPTCFTSLAEKTPIRTVAELKGKKLGVQSGSQQMVVSFLATNGIAAGDVDLVTVQYDIAPLVAGKVDAFLSFATNEPLVAAAEGYTPINILFAEHGQELIADHYAVTTQTLTSKRDMLIAFLAAESKGWADALQSPTQVADYSTKDFGKSLGLTLSTEVTAAKAQIPFISTADTRANGLLTITGSLAEATVKTLTDVYKTKVSVEDLFDLTVIDDVYQQHPELKVSNLPASA